MCREAARYEVLTDVLCAANSYNEKYYLNPDFDRLPEAVKKELQAMCVLYTADVGGIFTLGFDEAGTLKMQVTYSEGDPFFDEIGSRLKIGQLQREKEELFSALEEYYRVFVTGLRERRSSIRRWSVPRRWIRKTATRRNCSVLLMRKNRSASSCSAMNRT